MEKRHRVLTDLSRATLELKRWMDKNPPLDLLDEMYIENSIEMPRMAYASWKTHDASRRRSIRVPMKI